MTTVIAAVNIDIVIKTFEDSRSLDLLVMRKNFGRKDTSGYETTLLATV